MMSDYLYNGAARVPAGLRVLVRCLPGGGQVRKTAGVWWETVKQTFNPETWAEAAPDIANNAKAAVNGVLTSADNAVAGALMAPNAIARKFNKDSEFGQGMYNAGKWLQDAAQEGAEMVGLGFNRDVAGAGLANYGGGLLGTTAMTAGGQQLYAKALQGAPGALQNVAGKAGQAWNNIKKFDPRALASNAINTGLDVAQQQLPAYMQNAASAARAVADQGMSIYKAAK